MAYQTYEFEYTDTFGGEANYSWVNRGTVTVPELTHYGYTGSADGSYHRANKLQRRAIMREVKARLGLTGVKGKTCDLGDGFEFRPYRSCTVLFIQFKDC